MLVWFQMSLRKSRREIVKIKTALTKTHFLIGKYLFPKESVPVRVSILLGLVLMCFPANTTTKRRYKFRNTCNIPCTIHTSYLGKHRRNVLFELQYRSSYRTDRSISVTIPSHLCYIRQAVSSDHFGSESGRLLNEYNLGENIKQNSNWFKLKIAAYVKETERGSDWLKSS